MAAILPDGGKKTGTRESPNGERRYAGSEQSAANRVSFVLSSGQARRL